MLAWHLPSCQVFGRDLSICSKDDCSPYTEATTKLQQITAYLDTKNLLYIYFPNYLESSEAQSYLVTHFSKANESRFHVCTQTSINLVPEFVKIQCNSPSLNMIGG